MKSSILDIIETGIYYFFVAMAAIAYGIATFILGALIYAQFL